MNNWMEVYGSTHIDAASYDEDTKKLSVRFVGGDVYTYFDVPAEVWVQLQSAVSKGRFVNVVLRRAYRYEREQPNS